MVKALRQFMVISSEGVRAQSVAQSLLPFTGTERDRHCSLAMYEKALFEFKTASRKGFFDILQLLTGI